MKCSGCGAETTHLTLKNSKWQNWVFLPIMFLGFFPLMKMYFFKGDITKDLTISQVQKKVVGRGVEITGLITNNGKKNWTSVQVEVEFFDSSGAFLDEQDQYLRGDIKAHAQEYFKVNHHSAPDQIKGEDVKMVVKLSGREDSF